MTTWSIRHEGSSTAAAVRGPGEIVQGLREGLWLPTDEVRGPNDADWVAIESHPLFEEAALDLEPEVEKTDDTHLDMNPLIDVCLVLLIFFILTITYETLRRSIEVPPEQSDEKGKVSVNIADVKDRIFKVVAYMDGEKPVILVEGTAVAPDGVAKEIKAVMDKTGRRQMYLDVNGDVPWGILTGILDAAKGNGVHEILRRSNKK